MKVSSTGLIIQLQWCKNDKLNQHPEKKNWKQNPNITFWRFNILSYSWSTSSKSTPDFRLSIFAATKSLLSLIHLKSMEALHWGLATNSQFKNNINDAKLPKCQTMMNMEEKDELPFSSPAIVVGGSAWSAGNERARRSSGNGGRLLLRQKWGFRELRDGGLKIRREVEGVGKAASLRVWKQWSPIGGRRRKIFVRRWRKWMAALALALLAPIIFWISWCIQDDEFWITSLDWTFFFYWTQKNKNFFWFF